MKKLLNVCAVVSILAIAAACGTPAGEEPTMPDGELRCAFSGTGATIALEGERVNFSCEAEDAEKALAGDIEPGDEGWMIDLVTIGRTDQGFIAEETQPVTVDYIELDDGTICAFAGTGATAGYDDKRLNYTCDAEESGLFGDVVPGDEGWTIHHAYFTMTDEGIQVTESRMAPIAALHVPRP